MSEFIKRIDRSSLLLIFILLIALWFRIQGFLYGTFAFTYDVGRDFLAVSQMISSYKPLLIGFTTGLHGVFYGPTWYYLLSPFFILFQGNPSGIAFIMMLTGALTAWLSYLIGRRIGGNFLGLTFALFVGVSQVMTEISAQIWNPNPIPLFIAIVLLLLLRINTSSSSKKMLFFILGLCIGIIFDLELVFGVLFVFSSFVYFFVAGLFKKSKVNFILMISGFTFIQLPRVVFEFRHDFLMTRTLINSFISGEGESLITYVPRLSQTLERFFAVWKDTIAWQSPLIGLLVLAFVIFVFVKTARKVKKEERLILGYLFSVLFIFILGLSFFNHDIESHYYIGIPYVYIFIMSFSVYVAKKYLKFNAILLIMLVLIFSVLVNQLKLFGTFTKSTWVGDASVYRNQVEVVDYIYKDANGRKFNTITYTPPIHDYPYQYLFQWKGKNDYGYIPSKDYEELFYLIIEPDLQFPVRQIEWMKVREGDGVIVGETTFKSGIKVQKRIH